MVFHLDKCIGCHTCSIACKNIWTDRVGAEYMWWNDVETKPGTGYPTAWEDQEKYKGGWLVDGNGKAGKKGKNGKLRLRLQNKAEAYGNLFSNPALPNMDDYYEPWTYTYEDLFDTHESDDQPIARPISRVDGRPLEIEAGPNWDDDLGGSQIYAANDPDLKGLTDEEKQQLFMFEKLFYFYLPRICNHCLNPACLASCPSGAIYKRSEDGIVLINEDRCRAWRMCVSACPYKKTYFNWSTGKSEKCILCFPRQEVGLAPACFHSCVGRIRYLGVLLYDADRIEATASASDSDLVHMQRDLILNPWDEHVTAAASASGIPDGVIEAARHSPVYRYVKEWQLALPLHPEFRTLPMLFYVPSLLPVLSATQENGAHQVAKDQFSSLENARFSLRYMSNLFSAGNQEVVQSVYEKLIAVRLHQRAAGVGDITEGKATAALEHAGLSAQQAQEVYKLTTLATTHDRFVIPPMGREQAIETLEDTQLHKASTGFGKIKAPKRGA